MTQDLNTEIKIGADASGVETGVAGAKKALASLGQAADQVGRTGGEGLKKIGAGGEDSARRLGSATKNMVASLQRQIAAAEAGGTANRQYQESIARLRGADVNALKPYLDQLDAARDKAEKAARANAGLEGSMGSLSGAASLARSALTTMVGSITIGAFVDFVRGINDGIDALNDIKDATGSSIENISALEDVAKRTGHSMDSVTSTLVKFNQVLSEAKPGSAQELALKAIGLSAKELRDLDPAEALLKTAQALTEFEDDANKARLVQELFGKSIREVAPFLNDLAEKGKLVAKVSTEQADEAAKFNKQLSEMDANVDEAARALVGPMVTSLNTLIAKFKEGREAGRSFWSIQSENYWNWVSDFYGGSDKPAPAPFVPSGPGGGAGRGSVNPALPRPSVGNVPDANALKAAADAAKKAAEERKKDLQEQAKLMAELSGLTSSFAEDWNRLTAIYQAGGMSLEQYTKAQADLLAKQPGIKAAADAEVKAREAINKADLEAAQTHERYIASLLSGTDKIRADATAQEEATRRMGLSKEAVAELDAAKLEMLATDLELQAIKAMDRNLDEQAYTALKAQAEAYRGLASAKRAGASKEQWMDAQKASDDAAKKVTEEWKRSAEKIEDSLTDALMRGFESGKDFAKNLRDTVINMFKTMVLRPVISAIVNPVAGAVTGMMGLSGAANASTGGASMLGNVGSLFGAGGLSGSLAAGAGWLTGATTLGGSLSAGASLIGTGTLAGGMSGAGMIVGALGPIALGIGALSSIISSLDDSGTYHTGGAAQYSGARGLRTSLGPEDKDQFGIGMGWFQRGDQTISAVSGIAQGLGTALDGVAVAFGQKAGYEIATAFADDTSEDGAWGALRISKDGQELLNWQDTRTSRWAPKEFGDGEAGYKEYLAAVAKDTRQVLLDMDLPSWADKMLTSIGESASMEQLTGVLTQIGVVQSAFVSLGKSMEMFSGLTDEMQSGLLTAAGSIDALTAGAGAFYQGFYSEQERVDAAVAQLKKTLAGFDLSIDPTLGDDAKDQFRAAVEAAFAAGDADLAAGLLAISGNFATAADYFEQLSQSAADAATQAAGQAAQIAERPAAEQASIAGDLRRQIMELTGDTAAIRQLEIAGMNAANVALYDRVQALQAEAEQASIRADLDRQVLELTGDTAAIRQLEIAGMDAVNVALYDRIQALQSEQQAAEAAAQAAAEQASISENLQRQLIQLTGDTAAIRQLEIAGMDAVNVALYDRVQALQAEQQAAAEAQRAAEQAAQAQLELQQRTAEAMQNLQIELYRAQGDNLSAVAMERERELAALAQFGPAAVAMQQQIYGIMDAMSALESGAAAYFAGVDRQKAAEDYTDQGSDALSKFFGTAADASAGAAASAARASADAASTAAASWRSAAQSIQAAIDGLRAGTTDAMDPAARYALTKATLDAYTVSALGGDADAASKLSGAANDFLKASESGSTTHAQYLRDRVLAEAKLASVMGSAQAQASVQDTIAASAGAAVTQLEAMNANLTGFASTLYELLSTQYQGADRGTAEGVASTFGQMQADFDAYFNEFKTGSTYTDAAFNGGSFTRLSGDMAAYTDADGVISYLRATESVLDIAKRIPELRQAWEQQYGLKLPGYAVGTSYVPVTGPALLHEGEAVIPKAFNPWAGGGQGNGEMLAELRALRQTNERLEARLASIEESNRDMATILDNVTEGGNAMRSEVMA